jgi:hypothetical protein
MMVAAIDQDDAHWIIRPNSEIDLLCLESNGENSMNTMERYALTAARILYSIFILWGLT